jgi:hypothetical protein
MLERDLALLDSPRPANVLLLAGDVPPGLLTPAVVAHDAMSVPRLTVWWRLGAVGDRVARELPPAVVVEDEDPVPAIVRAHRDLLAGALSSEPPILPDVDPTPWRGVGPYGQGGSGMTGGAPYGRALPDRAEDRDGLMLDRLDVRIGPLVPALPPGLTLDVGLQGDVIQDVALRAEAAGRGPAATTALLRPFLSALDGPVPIAELELARARSHLRWVAWGLRVHGLPARAERVLRLARGLRPADAEAVRRLARSIRRTMVLAWATRGVGVLAAEALRGLRLGPVARAAGLAEDARADRPEYRRLDFEPFLDGGGDAAARWRQRLGEAVQSLELAERAGDRVSGPEAEVEGPRGTLARGDAPSERLVPIVAKALAGAEWGDAVTTLASLDLDLEEAAAVVRVPMSVPT